MQKLHDKRCRRYGEAMGIHRTRTDGQVNQISLFTLGSYEDEKMGILNYSREGSLMSLLKAMADRVFVVRVAFRISNGAKSAREDAHGRYSGRA